MRGKTIRSGIFAGFVLFASFTSITTSRVAEADGMPVMPPIPRAQMAPGTVVVGPLSIPTPRTPRHYGGMRLRSDAVPNRGSMGYEWHGIDIPAFVSPSIGDMTIEILDRTQDGGYLALYRDVTWTQCSGFGNALESANCDARAMLWDSAGQEMWDVPLNPLMSRRDHLEVQDIRYADGTLYFNEACQSYSREAGGRCSSLVAVDPLQKRVIWRTAPLVSNDAFLIAGDYIVALYGFTSEQAFIRVVRRRDGVVVDRESLPSSADDDVSLRGDRVSVNLYNMLGRVDFRMTGWNTDHPHLVRVT